MFSQCNPLLQYAETFMVNSMIFWNFSRSRNLNAFCQFELLNYKQVGEEVPSTSYIFMVRFVDQILLPCD